MKQPGQKDFKSKHGLLTLEEIHRLIHSPSEVKIDIIQNVAKYYQYGKNDAEEIRVAEQVFRALLKDTENKIRKTLADSIKNIEGVPHDVISSLARDIEEVSLPVLEFSQVLTELDLIDIISAASEGKGLAISKRKQVPAKVSDALIDKGSGKIVDSLLKNKGAEVSTSGYARIVENHGNNEEILGSMVERGSLPINVVERLTGTISNELYKKLSAKHKSAMNKLEEAIKSGRDMATLQVIGLKSSEEEFRQFMQLMKKLKVAEDLIPLSALCMANFNLFEVSIARRTHVSVANIRELFKDESNKGLRAIYGRAELPMHLYAATELLVDSIREIGDKLPQSGNLRLSPEAANRLIETIMVKADEKTRPENLEYLLSIIKHMAEGG